MVTELNRESDTHPHTHMHIVAGNYHAFRYITIATLKLKHQQNVGGAGRAMGQRIAQDLAFDALGSEADALGASAKSSSELSLGSHSS